MLELKPVDFTYEQEILYQALCCCHGDPGRLAPVGVGGRRKTQKLGRQSRVQYGPLYAATSLEQVRDYVRKENRLKVLGTRHCFNNIADSKDGFLSLKPMNEVIAIDPAKHTVTVSAGITYGQLCPYLDSKGFALHNLASLPHISVAGACSTATHGSGEKNGNLATAVSGLELVTASGDVVNLSRERDGGTFRGAVVGWARWA